MSPPRLKLELIGVPYNSAGRSGGVAGGPRMLRNFGLTGLLNRHIDLTDRGDIKLQTNSDVGRGTSGLVAEKVLVEMIGAVRDRTLAALDDGHFPLLIGGDCPVLLGGLNAVQQHFGDVGMLFVDGHEDAWPPQSSTTGEAADSELGLALGLYEAGLPATLAHQLPLLMPQCVTALGPRDEHDLEQSGIASIAGLITVIRPEALHTSKAEESLATLVHRETERIHAVAATWWLHVDLDVLATDQLRAVDYPQTGGLSWPELDTITAVALASPGCAGWSICIYNPDLDPEQIGVRRILAYIDRALTRTATERTTAGGSAGDAALATQEEP